MDLLNIKNWLRIDYDYDDNTIEDILVSAKEELLLSGVPEYKENEEGYALYCMAIKYIIARDYESRGYIKDSLNYRGQKTFNEKALHSFILKLKKW